MSHAQQSPEPPRTGDDGVLDELVEPACALARSWAGRTDPDETPAEASAAGTLAALVRDPAGLDLAIRFVDRVARPEDHHVAARDLARISPRAARGFLDPLDATLLGLGTLAAPLAPRTVVGLARRRLRGLVGHLVVDAADPDLAAHLARLRDQGFRVNVNLLGEAVLGEGEAAARTRRVIDLLARPDVDYVSIKLSGLVSQITPWDVERTVARSLDRLRPLYRAALDRSPYGFVNLDMEEYRDLEPTLALFTALMTEPEFAELGAGIAVQAYLPDALPAIERLLELGARRADLGWAPIKIRLVKGANLAMERVEARLRGWVQAPYATKPETDANYVRCLEAVLRAEVRGVRLGVASHNLYDVALALLLARRRGVRDRLDIEMLHGMAPGAARAVLDAMRGTPDRTPVGTPDRAPVGTPDRAPVGTPDEAPVGTADRAPVGTPDQAPVGAPTHGDLVLYTPVVAPGDFDVAIAYLVRRLEESAAPENYLHALCATPDRVDEALRGEEAHFVASVAARHTVAVGARRGRAPDAADTAVARAAAHGTPHDHEPVRESDHEPDHEPDRESGHESDHEPDHGADSGADSGSQHASFVNAPDSDPALPQTRRWAATALAEEPPPLTSPLLTGAEDIDAVVGRALAAGASWAARSARERAEVLLRAADALEARRGEFLAVMAAEGGKTVAEADPEVSEAVDFARYYAARATELETMETGETGETGDAAFTPDRLVLVTPPWNFPVAIPAGGVLAALAAGAAVIVKPARHTPGCVELVVSALVAAGVPGDAVQVVRTASPEVGRLLVTHRDVDTVLLTGSAETAAMFGDWRAERLRGPRVFAETSGKNALIVTPAADLDLAVADLVRSAYGHAGQKCSAASLGILVGSVAVSERFRRQLVDAVTSLRVGCPGDLGATMGPLIEPPTEKLARSLTTLEAGESWLVEPHRLDDSGRLWSPGLKDGVAPGSFFHHQEAFGPVLGLMAAPDLATAIEWANGTAYGLTSGLHSLDETEIASWRERIEAGNLYANRHITGAVVGRQPFGGWKGSVVGPGAKAGGPNYVAQLGTWHAHPRQGGPELALGEPRPPARELTRALLPLVEAREDRLWLRTAVANDASVWARELGGERELAGLVVESNVFRYRPVPVVWLRTAAGCRVVDLVRVLAGAACTGTAVRVSLDPETSRYLKAFDGTSEEASAALRALSAHVDRAEPDDRFAARVASGEVAGRVRLVPAAAGPDPALVARLVRAGVTPIVDPVLAAGRRELLCLVREQAISTTRHRYGHVAHAGTDRR